MLFSEKWDFLFDLACWNNQECWTSGYQGYLCTKLIMKTANQAEIVNYCCRIDLTETLKKVLPIIAHQTQRLFLADLCIRQLWKKLHICLKCINGMIVNLCNTFFK